MSEPPAQYQGPWTGASKWNVFYQSYLELYIEISWDN